jgi:hypothetical protein
MRRTGTLETTSTGRVGHREAERLNACLWCGMSSAASILVRPGVLLMLQHWGILSAPEPRHPSFPTAGISLATLNR